MIFNFSFRSWFFSTCIDKPLLKNHLSILNLSFWYLLVGVSDFQYIYMYINVYQWAMINLGISFIIDSPSFNPFVHSHIDSHQLGLIFPRFYWELCSLLSFLYLQWPLCLCLFMGLRVKGIRIPVFSVRMP